MAKKGFDEISESQKVLAQTQAVLESTGGAANVTAGQVENLAGSLSDMSGVDDELIASGENLLLTFKKIRNEAGAGNDIFDQATVAALDLSVALGKDLNSSALMIGKALNDPIAGLTALGRAGVQFTVKQKDQIKAMIKAGDVMGAQKLILAELTSQVGGSAKAFGETLPGQLGKAQNQFDEVAATLMTSLLPAITAVLGGLTRFTEWAKSNPTQMKLIVAGVTALAAALVAASVAQMALNLAVLANPFVAAAVGVAVLVAAMVVLYKKFAFVRRHWQLLLLAFGLGPVIIATIVKAIIRHWDSIRPVLVRVKGAAVAAFNAIRAAVMPVVNQIVARFNALKAVAVAVFRGVAAAVGPVVAGMRSLASAVRAAVGPIQTLVGWLRTLWGWLSSIFGRVWKLNVDLPSPGGGVPFVPGIASGGTITRGGLAVVHQGESLIPAARVNRGRATPQATPWVAP